MSFQAYKYKNSELGGTLHLKGDVYYQGGRDELNTKLRIRDDEIDRLRARITELEAQLEALGH